MHVPDGILPLPVTIGGYLLSGAIAWGCIRRIERRADPHRNLPRAAMLTAAFFVASMVHFPVPPVSVHLLLNGLLGALLGWFAFPAILVGLLFQAVIFGHGGITTLGVNGLIIGLPALAAFALFRLRTMRANCSPRTDALFGFVAGAVALALSAIFFMVTVVGNLPAHLDATMEQRAITAFVIAHLPLVVIEGVVCALLIGLFARISPGLLRQP